MRIVDLGSDLGSAMRMRATRFGFDGFHRSARTHKSIGGIVKKDFSEMNPYVLAIPVLAIGLQDSASACISPAIASICATYPEIPVSTVQLLVTLPSIACCVVAIFYGWLSVRINPRTLVIAGLVLFVVGGMLPMLLTSFYGILACRIVLGMGAGLTLPACDSIIPRLYKGRLRENMMGWNMTVGAVGCTIMIFVGGQFAVKDWHLSFLGYGVGLISLVLVLALLPRIPMVKGDKGEKPTMSAVMTGVKWLAWIEIAVYFVGNMLATLVTSNLSLFVEGAGIGTAADTGFALSIQMIGAAFGAFFYGWLKHRLGYFVIPFSWGLMALGFFVVSNGDSLTGVYAGMVVAGVGVGIVWPAYCIRITELCKPASQAMAIAIAGALQGFGNFFNPVIGAWCVALLGIGYGADLIAVSSGALTAICAMVLVVSVVSRKRARLGE